MVFYNHDVTAIIVCLNIFQKKEKLGSHENFYKFAFMGLFLMICIIFVLGLFFGALNLGNSGYDIKNEVTTAQPSTTTSIILYFLASLISHCKLSNLQFISDDNLTNIEIPNPSSVCKSKEQYIYKHQIYIFKTTNHFS